jgi:restriction system protein
MIPDYQSLMLPILRLVADRKGYKYRDIIEKMAVEFNISDAE